MIGLALSAPPDGLIAVSPLSPIASRRISSWWLNGAWISAMSKPPAVAPAFSAAGGADGDSARLRTPRAMGSMRWSMPRIHAGRSQCSRAKSPAAMIIAAAPSVIGGQSLFRSGSTIGSSARCSSTERSHFSWALGLPQGVAAAAGGDLGHLLLGEGAGLEADAGLHGGEADLVGPQRRDAVGVELAGQDLVDRARRRLAVAVDEGAVDVAELELHPRLVEGEGAVHLDVALLDRRPRPDAVEGHDEAEADAGEVVGGARHREADVVLGDAGAVAAPPRAPASASPPRSGGAGGARAASGRTR